ncbi:MAG: winged helix DNA-binding protein [Trueperaceae bacterium]
MLMVPLALMAPKANSSEITRAVVKILLAEKNVWLHAYKIAQKLNTRDGTISNILNRLERRGWLESKWETRRKLFKPTVIGQSEFQKLIWGNSPDNERNT